VLVTAIKRGRNVIRPIGDTVLERGDRLTLIGTTVDVNRLEQLSASREVEELDNQFRGESTESSE
jgi:Trk K+ transport system NAD-binding subunit